jgi:hypothetical protein
MKNKLAGRLSLQEAIAQTLADTKEKLASAKGEGDKVKKLVDFEKKEHGHIPTAKEEKAECEKTSSASVIDPQDPEQVEKLAAALESVAEKLAADHVVMGGESHQGGQVLPVQAPASGKQPVSKAHATAAHVTPKSTGMIVPKDNKGAATAVPTDDNRAPGGTGAKYPAKGVLKTGSAVDALQAVVEKAIEKKATSFGELSGIAGTAGAGALAAHAMGHDWKKGAMLGGATAIGAKALATGVTHSKRNAERLQDQEDAIPKADDEQYAREKTRDEDEKRASNKKWYSKHDPAVAEKAASVKEESAVDYLLKKISGADMGGESHQGGETLSSTAPVPSNAGRQMISSNSAPKGATKREAKAPRKAELKQVLTEPALSSAHDDVVNKSLRNASKGGVKIAAARALLEKISQEGCQCGGDVTCRYCKMKKTAASMKTATPTETVSPQAV